MFEIQINNKKIEVDSSLTIIQACKAAGVEIPRFCYHEKLSIAGNCRMCLVEVKVNGNSMPKPVASCAMPVGPKMEVLTDTLLVRKAREGVMEYLLSNHPLDCPVCDQGGECDLQDQAMLFGNDRGRFYEEKRAVEDKNCGPLVKTIMTRCIHCTRCVRFSTEVAGMDDLGVTGRGNSMEIGTYISNILKSEISGNIIDLCPVGALTSKPYAYLARPWELKTIETVDLHDSMGSNLKVCIRGMEVLRVLPLINEGINEEWITDKARFAYDGYKLQRLQVPYSRNKAGNLIESSWEEAFKGILYKLFKKNYQLDMVLGTNVDMEAASMAKDFCSNYGDYSIRTEYDFNRLNLDSRRNYSFNSTISGIEEADICVLIGTNIRLEMPLLAARLRKEERERGMPIVSIGNPMEDYLNSSHLGNSGKSLLNILEGRHPLCKSLRSAKKPMFIIGTHGMQLNEVNSLKTAINSLEKYVNLKTEDWDGVNYVQLGGNQVGLYDLGIGSEEVVEKKNKVLYLLGVNSLEINEEDYDFIIYQGDYGNELADKADFILPGCNFIEKEGTYVNMEGRAQNGKLVFYPKGEARNDWTILRALSEYLFRFIKVDINNLRSVRERLDGIVPVFLNAVPLKSIDCKESLGTGFIKVNAYTNYIYDYYRTDNISRASKVMAVCSSKLKKYKSNFKWK